MSAVRFVSPMLLVLVCTSALPCDAAHAADRPPNVVMLISDDQAWSDYGFMGHDVIETPALDKLASQSAVFAHGYVPSSLCRPSLMTMITGLYPHQHGITGNDPADKKNREGMLKHSRAAATLPELLGERGYLSHQSGKWWEGHYSEGGFTHGMTHGESSRGGRHGDQGLKIGREGLQPVFDFIAEAGDRPFFIWYAPFMPHTPHTPPQRLLDKYSPKVDSPHVAKYYAMCEWFDETCGQLLDYLDEHGLGENTVVAYVCDNGWIQQPDGRGYAPKSKRSPYDGGIRTPIMVRWKGKISPGRYDSLASSIDLAPTILRACGLEPTADMPGVDLARVVGGNVQPQKEMFGEIFEHDVPDVDRPEAGLLYRWCIQGKWKLILPTSSDETPELYDLGADPWEENNLAAQQPELVAQLTERIEQWWSLKE